MGWVAVQHQLLGWQGYGRLWGKTWDRFLWMILPQTRTEIPALMGLECPREMEIHKKEHHCENTPA